MRGRRPAGQIPASPGHLEAAMAEPFTTLRTQVDQRVMTVTLDHPPVNLMDRRMLRDLRALLDLLQQDTETRVVVFRSANREFFICHADLTIFLKDRPAPPRSSKLNFIHTLFEEFRTLPKATIALIEGRCNGAGTEFVTSLDMRFAADGRAFLGQFEVALGGLPGGTGTQRLPALMGRSRALELILGCDELDAHTAERYGLINRAIDPSEIDRFVDNLARRIATFPRDAIALAKQSVDYGLGDPAGALSEESFLAGQLMATEEVRRRFAAVLARGAQTLDGERSLAGLLPGLGGRS
jgi:enoyl-CoA hydratase/carnithine racemase